MGIVTALVILGVVIGAVVVVVIRRKNNTGRGGEGS
jgi:hypothetical protein